MKSLYPEGGGTVGVANEAFRNRSPTPSYSTQADGMAQLAQGLKAYMGKAPAATGSAPIAAAPTQASATGLSQAPTVMAGTPATANLGGGGVMSGIGNAMSSYVAPAIAMTGLVKAGNKLKIGAKDQAHLYSKMLKKFTGMF